MSNRTTFDSRPNDGFPKKLTQSLFRNTQYTIRNTLLLLLILPILVSGAEMQWDFTKGQQGWVGNNGVSSIEATPEGLLVRTTDDDPWIEGPAVDLPGAEASRVTVRMKSDTQENAELFYGPGFSAERSARFIVRPGGWRDYELFIPYVLGPGTRFRLDPCVRAATVTVGSITIESIKKVASPEFAPPEHPGSEARELIAQSGLLKCEQHPKRWGGLVLSVSDTEMAVGYDHDLIGVVLGDTAHYLDLGKGKIELAGREGKFDSIRSTVTDPDGATWQVTRAVRPGAEGSIEVTVSITVDRARNAVHLPWMTLFPGLKSFGEHKTQALFPGLEYLSDEPSSSTADIEGPEHIRRIPDPVKITFPLMAINNGGRYIGLIWEPGDLVAATFDSPDTIYKSQAHVMALTGPGIGELRFPNALNAHRPVHLEANKPLTRKFTIIGGLGASVVEPVHHYVRLHPLPPLPEFKGGYDRAVELLAHGWLDSKINESGLFRHAVWGTSFGAQPAADACMYIDYLANNTDPTLSKRLTELRDLGLSKIPADNFYTSTVSHARLLSAPFIFGRMPEFAVWVRDSARDQLHRFDTHGLIRYRPGKTDYGRTHYDDHANGFSGPALVSVLYGATFSNDLILIDRALDLLNRQTAIYANTVPRGAQTWECPLHTPDILASAHMVRAYTLGYILSGREEYLEQARYWAWTGVPFIYLVNPTDGPTGPYATIAVLCATNWKAPVWFGQPVQWCGLVYASSLQLLADYDTEGPWKQIADGITLAGLRESWPESDTDRQGLLPDYFLLRPQVSDGPAINPGTVQAHLPEVWNKGKLYDIKKVPGRDWIIHAPCEVSEIADENGTVTFKTAGWADKPYQILIAGPEFRPRSVRVAPQGVRMPPRPANYRHDSTNATLLIDLKGPTWVIIK